MANKIYSQNGLLLGIPTGGSTQNLKAGDGITIDDNYISVDAHTEGNIDGNGTTDNPIKLKDIINLDEVHANTVVGIKGNFGDVLIGRSDKVSTFIEKVKDLEANQHEYTGSEHIDVSDDYVISLKDDVALKSDIPSLDNYAKKSDLNEYVDKDELANYYTKDETYNQDQITSLIQSIGYNAGDHISIDEDTKTISVVDLVGTTVTSNNGTVTVVPSENEDGSMNYDLSVVPGGGSDVNILGSWPVYANNIGDGVWSIGADLHEWIKGEDVDEKLESYQKLLIAGDGINIENNVISSVETLYTGTSPIIVNGHTISFDDSSYAKKTDVTTEEAARIAADAELLEKINEKPSSYVAGDNISIVDNTISVTGIVDKLHEYTGDQYISVDNVNDKITLTPAWVDWNTYRTEQTAIDERATSLESRMTVVETDKADKTDLNNYFTKSETYDQTAIDGMLTGKQDELTAGDHISINGNVISAVGFQEPGDYATNAELNVETNARIAGDNALAEEIAEKQDPINAGAHIRIDDGITINAVGFAEQSDFEQAVDELHKDIEDINDEIDDLNQNKQDKLTAGSNISITNNVISATGLQPAGDYATKSELNNEKTAREQADSVLSDSKQDKLTAGAGIKIENNVISIDSTTDDVWDLIAGDNITIEKNEETEEVIISAGGTESVTQTYNYGLSDHKISSIKYTDGMVGNSTLTISTDDDITGEYSMIKKNMSQGFIFNQGAGLLIPKMPTNDGVYGINKSGNFEEIKSEKPVLFNAWNFLNNMLRTKSDISRTESYPTTLLSFDNTTYGTFTIPANATVQMTICTEQDTCLTWTRATDDASKKFSFGIILNSDKVELNGGMGDCYWTIPELSTERSYTSACRPTTFYFKTKNEPVNSWELLKFIQNGVAYNDDGYGSVTFKGDRLIIRGMYWV